MTRSILSFSAVLLSFVASQAQALPMPEQKVVECRASSASSTTIVKVFTVPNGKTYARYTLLKKSGASVIEAWEVRAKRSPAVGGSSAWVGKNFSLSVNFTTAPQKDGSRSGSLMAEVEGARVIETLNCKR